MGRRTLARARRPLDTKSGGREAEREWHGRHMHRRCIDGKSLAYHETAVPRLAKVAPFAAMVVLVCVIICLSNSSVAECTFDALLVDITLIQVCTGCSSCVFAPEPNAFVELDDKRSWGRIRYV